MAEKLLLGWTMLSDVCPTSGCLFPLMLDGNGDTTCVACGNDCVKTHDEAEGSQRQVDNPTGATTAKTAPSDVVNVSRSCSDGVLSEEKFAALRDQRDKVSATIGRMMLQGWCLLNDICSRPECESSPPLLLDKRTGTLYCTACDKYEEVASPSKSTSSAQAALPVKRSSDGEEQSPLKEEVTPTADLEPAEVCDFSKRINVCNNDKKRAPYELLPHSEGSSSSTHVYRTRMYILSAFPAPVHGADSRLAVPNYCSVMR